MSRSFDTYPNDIYSRFCSIDESSYREIINFYEQHLDQFLPLEYEDHLDIRVTYGAALFEVGRYDDFILLADDLIESVIYQNIKYLNGEDIFEKLLFKKAAAHYQLMELDQAEKILWELLKMDPTNSAATYLLKRCKIKRQPGYMKSIKAISIFLFLLAAFVIAVELLIIRPFFAGHSDQVEMIRTGIFVCGVCLLLAADGWHRVRSFHEVNRVTDSLRTTRSRKVLRHQESDS